MRLPNLYTCKIGIIGLGYVGLPLALLIARKNKCNITNFELYRKIVGFDSNKERIKELNENYDRTGETNLNEIINAENIFFTSEEKSLKECEVFIITVPTPINKNREPELNFLRKACLSVGRVIKNSFNNIQPIVIFESTVYPGTTEEICVPIIEKESSLTHGIDFFCAYSPERINPGDKKRRLEDIVKVTSGFNKETAKWVDKFYGSFINAGTFLASSVKVAEAAKVIENTQRDLNIALVNELSVIFSKMKIDTLDVLDTASSKWNFIDFRPGFVGGHCIGVDPYYLAWKIKQYGYNAEILLSGRKVNENMTKFVFKKIVNKLSNHKNDLRYSKILICGYTFKENCPDVRNSKVPDLVKLAIDKEFIVDIFDPLADLENLNVKMKNRFIGQLPYSAKYDVIIITLANNKFKEITYDKFNSLLNDRGFIFDLKGILGKKNNVIRP